ncbi:unnamed protein product [Nippostrongylus brasiliensis]|uniref:Phage protein n=1 Tax=Nippostrongylus brasiliensis TaxID=27835 RepID=A0A0N4XZQ0_NIPBR|nr:unnamed protein product [Nippostrongylus brasiliensis]
MSLYFHKSSLKRITTSLTSQIDTFRGFANEPQFPEELGERKEFCLRRVAAIENAASIINASRNEILAILDAVHKDYAELKKSERKEFIDEFQTIENEVQYDKAIFESDALLTALRTRLGEVKYEYTAILTKEGKGNPTVKLEKGALADFHDAIPTDTDTPIQKEIDDSMKVSVTFNASDDVANSAFQTKTLRSTSFEKSKGMTDVNSENTQEKM